MHVDARGGVCLPSEAEALWREAQRHVPAAWERMSQSAEWNAAVEFGEAVATWLHAKWNPWELQVQRLRVGRTPARVICMYHPGGSNWEAKAFAAAPGTPYRLAAAGLVAVSSARPGR